MGDLILKIEKLSVELGKEKIIDNLDLEVREKETLIILGPNGAGKTVLLRTLLGSVPFKGRIKWREGIKIGYVPQRVPLVKDIPVSVADFFSLKNISPEKTKKSLISVGVEPRSVLKKKINEISSGQFQRIMIAWSLADEPQVLLFDEPFAGIDVGGEETIYGLLEKIKKEKELTIFLVTHDLNIVYKEATNVLCLNKKMICHGKPKEILNSRNLSKLFKGKISFYHHQHE